MSDSKCIEQLEEALDKCSDDNISKLSDQNIDLIAQSKYNVYNFNDPFKEIAPALLNPKDVEKYINKTGMISPFDKDNLKSVTYRIPLYGDIHYWENNVRYTKSFNRGSSDYFELKPNSIVYIHIDTTFRVPYYIAFRFNLKIDLVHKGLLLGTGPVVDPGFQGRIMIPIHNLTANTYNLKAGDGLIWVEVTKLSKFDEDIKEPPYKFKDLTKFTANDYFKAANDLKKIQSSIPEYMGEALKNSDDAKDKVNKLQWGGIIAAIAIVLAGYTLVANVITPTISLIDNYKKEQLNNTIKIKKLEEEIKELKNENK